MWAADLCVVLSEVRALLNEVDCRIEHGAESDGHLEYVRDRLRVLLDRAAGSVRL